MFSKLREFYFFTFFEMFSKLGLLMREKASRKTSAPL